VGDIGNKMGYEGMDNGFIMFKNYRQPRDAMLMRYAKVCCSLGPSLNEDYTFVHFSTLFFGHLKL